MENRKNKEPEAGNAFDLPIGLGFAFAQNFNALTAFASLDDDEKNKIIAKASKVKSREEMRELADAVGDRDGERLASEKNNNKL